MTGRLRVVCALEYDGSGFRGWQRQGHDARTVQSEVERAIGRVADHPITTICAGRTDSGVHAAGQVIHFDTTAERPEKAWVMGVNSHLPAPVAIRWARYVPDSFHARFSAIDRHYTYLVHEGLARPALWHGRAAWSVQRLDERAMERAAACLEGERDFSAFRSAECQSRTPMRRIDWVRVRRFGDLVRIDIRGNAFLHNMVRIIAGSLMAVGRGDRSEDWLGEVLAARDRTLAGPTATADGLYFLGPGYPAAFGLPRAAGDLWPGGSEAASLC